jgi:alpha-ketoglutarate-dependent taurine dioxygenase
MVAVEISRVAMLQDQVTDSRAWTRDTIGEAQWRVPIPPDCLDELRQVLAEIRRDPLPMFLLTPDQFALDACRALMGRVRRILDQGVMFAVVDRLPMEEMSRDESAILHWLLSSLVARPVAQKRDGTMSFSVRDTGAKLQPGSGIRPTVTNVDLTFHNDNSYNETPPDYVTLLCQQTAKEGGVSRVMSAYTAHNALLRHHRDLLPRLYRPFWYDRHREHGPDEATTHPAPIFEFDGADLKARLALLEIRAGYALRNERIDNETEAALAAVKAVFDTPELRIDLDFKPGQIQYVNNRSTGHARTDFVDYDEPERRRQLVRLWLRDGGRRCYRG